MGPCHSVGPKTVQIICAKDSVYSPSLSLTDLGCHLGLCWCVLRMSHIFERFTLLNVVQATLSCDVQCLSLYSWEHRFLVSQHIPYPPQSKSIFKSQGALALILVISHFVLSKLERFFLHQPCFKASAIVTLIVSSKIVLPSNLQPEDQW